MNVVWLYPAYIANIVILVPVLISLVPQGGTERIFAAGLAESDGLRLLVASLWSAICVTSLAGLIWPAFFAPVLLIQIIYKSLWLMLFVVPLLRAGEVIPSGVASVFLMIVLTYPVLFYMAVRG